MKHNFSDLLDEVLVDDIELNEKTLLSSRRIKARTMGKIGQKKTNTLRWLPRVAVIAAVVMVLTVTAFAADAVWNDGNLFRVFFGSDLSDDQTALMDDIGKLIGQSVTRSDATITALQAVADESFCWIHLKVEAPEGVVLPDLEEDENYFYYLAGKNVSALRFQHRFHSDAQWIDLGYGHIVKPLADSNPNDNVKEFVVVLFGQEGKNTFRRSGQTRLYIPGLYIHKGKEPYLKTLFTGSFVFDISMDHVDHNDLKLVIDTEGVTFHNESYDYTTRVNKVTISPLHVDIDFTATAPNDPLIFPYGGPLEIVMKDGTKIQALEAFFDAREQTVATPEDVAGPKIVYFDTPVVVDNIDYIVLGGEYIFDVN